MDQKSQLSVLIIDDKPDESEILAEFFATDGHKVFATADAGKALDLLRQREGEFQLVVLDLMMPQLSGLDLLPQIRRVDSDIDIFIFTGYPSVSTAAEVINYDVSAYIEKPFDRDKFRAAVGRIAKRRGLALNAEEALHKAIGHNIRELRRKRGLTLRQLANRTNLSVSLLSQIERAESSASVSSLFKVATALDLKITDLFSGF